MNEEVPRLSCGDDGAITLRLRTERNGGELFARLSDVPLKVEVRSMHSGAAVLSLGRGDEVRGCTLSVPEDDEFSAVLSLPASALGAFEPGSYAVGISVHDRGVTHRLGSYSFELEA